jgi:hypothetical protein
VVVSTNMHTTVVVLVVNDTVVIIKGMTDETIDFNSPYKIIPAMIQTENNRDHLLVKFSILYSDSSIR